MRVRLGGCIMRLFKCLYRLAFVLAFATSFDGLDLLTNVMGREIGSINFIVDLDRKSVV